MKKNNKFAEIAFARDLSKNQNVRWVLNTSCSDQNCLAAIPRLTDEELIYCLNKETRKTGVANLRREAKKRGIAV